MINFQLIVIAAALVAVVGLTKLLRRGRRPTTLPPGPPTVPLLGNLHMVPKKNPHLQFQKWAQDYGSIYSLILGTKTFIVLNSDVVVKDLLDKRSNIYSSRPALHVGQDLVSGGLRVLFMQYGETWRMIRKMVHNILNISAAKSYVPYQDLENKQMLVGVLEDPGRFFEHFRRYSNSLTTQMVFGFRTTAIDDPKLIQLFDGFEKYSEASNTGMGNLIDLFPVMKKLPDFLVPYRAYAKQLHVKEKELYMGHWMNVKEAIKAGTAKPCFCVDLVKAQDSKGFSDDLACYISGSLLEAGSDTTAATLMAFVQAMVLFPEVQKKAQEEIDRVVGSDRFPTMEDEFDLQYIRGCVKESMRWFPTDIMSVPHAVTQDDEYMGYHIPAGATIINNVYTIHMDPTRYPNPKAFDPSRFANDFQTAGEAAANPDPSKRDHFTLGTGRRICQGMHIAERSLFLGMSRYLWAFNTSPAMDTNGKPMLPDPAHITQGLFVGPEHFFANIAPRSAKHADLVRREWAACAPLLDGAGQWKEVPAGMAFSTYNPKDGQI